MSKFFQRFLNNRRWSPSSRNVVRRSFGSRQASYERTTCLLLEHLEDRRLLATDLGLITGHVSVFGTSSPADIGTESSITNTYEFEIAGGDLDIQLTGQPGILDNLSILLQVADINITIDGLEIGSDNDLNRDEIIHTAAPAGRYVLEVRNNSPITFTPFSLQIALDRAGGPFVEAGADRPTNFLDGDGKDYGLLLEDGDQSLTDFVGYLQGGHLAGDLVDVHLFTVPVAGQVTVRIDDLVPKATFNGVDCFVFLIHDADGDGVFERETNELIDFNRLNREDEIYRFDETLAVGRYAVVMSWIDQPLIGGMNYDIDFDYDVPDTAPDSLASARNLGVVGNTTSIAISEYLSESDPEDIFRFTTVAGGPFVFEGSVTIAASDANFELDFIRDLDGDGRIDGNEGITSDRPDIATEELNVTYPQTGIHFVRVRRTSGEGPYVLRFRNRNNDLAGNSLPVARTIGQLDGVFQFGDTVSASDVSDIYKFSLNRQATFRAQLSGIPLGADANLSLIRDFDGDGLIDKDDVLVASNNSGNASESILRNLTAGTYFVRVNRIAGTPSYNLRIVKDAVGDSLGAALTLSASGGSNADFLGPEDDTDVYRFVLASARQVGIVLGINQEPLSLQLGKDANSNGTLELAEVQLSQIIAVGPNHVVKANLTSGTHFIVLNPLIQDEGTNYALSILNQPTDNAGNTLGAARNAGVLGAAAQIFNDFVGDGAIDLVDDLDDFYRFSVGNNGPFTFNARLFNQRANANLELIRDINFNFVADRGEVLASTNVPGTAEEVLAATITTPGTYFLRVKRGDGQASYTLSLSAFSQDTAGNSLGNALDLGLLSTSINSPNHFVGRVDPEDFFRFSISSPGELRASLNNAAQPLHLEVIRDTDGDLAFDPDELLGSTHLFTGNNEFINGLVLPVAGAYFARLVSNGIDSNFAVGLEFSNQLPFQNPFVISDDGPTEIKAVRFDRGAEGVAYSDSTPTNTGDQPGFRSAENIGVDVYNTTDPLSGGRRVTNTAPGEFLEYTLIVNDSGFYDFDARVSSPEVGATFHLEIDGVSIGAPVAIPDTNSEDTMISIAAASNVVLAAGPHILRLAIDTDTVADGVFAGSFNFITVRPATTGTFDVTPDSAMVDAGERTQLSLSWTVPVGGWRVLKEVDLRLRDESGRLIWLRFEEVTNTIRMFNSSTGQFGPAKTVGSNNVLSGPLADLYLGTTTVAANGASDPTVVFTFDLRFKAGARGHYTIEASASDDLGHADPFSPAGTMDIV